MPAIRHSTTWWVRRNLQGSIVPRIAARTAVTNTASTPNASATFADSSQPKREPMQAKPSQRMSNSATPLRNSRATTNGLKRRAKTGRASWRERECPYGKIQEDAGSLKKNITTEENGKISEYQ